jgi:UPF0716 protein FxsA
MRRLCFVALFVFPILDIVVTRELASRLESSVWWWFAAAAVVGIWLIRHEGLSFRARFMAALTAAVSQDTNPWRSVINSARKVLAGVLLILPGVLTDVLALTLLLIPINVASRLVPAWVASTVRPQMGSRTIDGSYRRVD